MCDSNSTDRIIIPPAQALEIVTRAGNAYLRACPCRVQEQHCPRDTWEVCLLFEPASPDDLRGVRPISTDEALAILKSTADRKAIYNLFYTHTDRQITEMCSCCTCCCRPLNRLKRAGRYGEELRSGYVAVTDTTRCTGCGSCEADCFFEARRVEAGAMQLEEQRCFGCGRCVNACPEGAISLERKIGHEAATLEQFMSK